ncbi:MAG: radical SAM protein [Chloroflexota bacterium]|nr:radical SAM protein [Chloroflexota bacterium]
MELFNIPLQSPQDQGCKFIIFRPLLGIAFIGNDQMADLTREILTNDVPEKHQDKALKVRPFLESIGFLEKDPPPPRLPNNGAFHPTHTVLLLTNRCQMRCIYCYASGGELTPEDLSVDTAKKAIDIVHMNAVKQNRSFFSVSFHGGGEPMMAWDVIKECAAYANEKSLPVKMSLTSNGVWSENQCCWIIENIDSISLSMDGYPAVQDHNRPLANGARSSPILERTIKRLDENHKNYGIRITAIPPWSDLPKSVAYLFEHTQCKGIQVEPAFNSQRGEHTLPSEDQANQFISAFLRTYDISRKYQRSFRYSAARITNPVRTFCTAPYNTLIVNPQNEVVGCYEITNHDHELTPLLKFGQIDSSGLHLIKGKREALLEIIDKNREKCSDCFCFWHCAGDCFARTLTRNEDGGYNKQTQRCLINQTLTKELLLRKLAQENGVAKLYQHVKINNG